jgi:hypothetical protein
VPDSASAQEEVTAAVTDEVTRDGREQSFRLRLTQTWVRTPVAALAAPVAPGGTLLVIARATNDLDPVRDPAMMPWALTRRELELAGGPLRLVTVEQFLDDEDPPKLRWRAEFRREEFTFPG